MFTYPACDREFCARWLTSSIGYFVIDLFGLGILAAIRSKYHRALHDHVFGSVVVVDETSPFSVKNLLSRFIAFGERQLAALKANEPLGSHGVRRKPHPSGWTAPIPTDILEREGRKFLIPNSPIPSD